MSRSCMMGSESSVMERPEGWDGNHSDGRSRSPSPLPRYEDPRNSSQYDTQGMDGLPLFPSTMPERRTARGALEEPQLPRAPASEPNDMDAEHRRTQRKKKKKKHRSLGPAHETERELEPEPEPEPGPIAEPELPRPNRVDYPDDGVDSAEERRRREEPTPKRKKKKRLSGPSWQPAGDEDPTRTAALALSLVPSTPPTEESPRKKKWRGVRNNDPGTLAPIAEHDMSPLNGVEIIPSSLRSPGKRDRRSSGGHKSPKRRRLASPFEPADNGSKEFGVLEDSIVESHLNGNSQPIVDLYDRSRRQLSASPLDLGLKAAREDPADKHAMAAQNRVETTSSISSQAPGAARDEPMLSSEGESEDASRPGQLQQPDFDMEMGGMRRPRQFEDEIESVGSDEQGRRTNRQLSIESESESTRVSAPQISEDAPEQPDESDLPENGAKSEFGEASLSIGSRDESNADETDSSEAFTAQSNGISKTSSIRGGNMVKELARRRLGRPLSPGSEDRNRASEVDEVGDSASEVSAAHEAQETPTRRRPLPTGRRKLPTERPKAVSENPEPPARDPEESLPDDAGESSSAPRSSAKPPGSGKRRRRKPKTPYFDRQEEEEAKSLSELPGSENNRRQPDDKTAEASHTQKAKKPRKKTAKAGGKAAAKAAKDEDPPLEGQYRTGALTGLEQQQVRNAVEKFRENRGLTQEEVNAIIHENPQKQKDPMYREIWVDVADSCPTRPRQKLINWCRQNFHNFVARGTWTKEQDDELEELIERHGKKWAVIGSLINRHQNDIRDRYRNYIVCRNKVKLDYWSKEEEEQLYDAVQEAMDRIREDKSLKDSSEDAVTSLINWQLVAEQMGFTRSRLQCMKKWRLLGESREIPEALSSVLPTSSGWRLEAVREDLKKITVQEKFKLVRAISDSKARRESGIPWREIVQDVFGGVYERKALMVTWARLRQTVPDWETTVVKKCAKYLVDRYEAEGEFGNDGVDDNVTDAEAAVASQRSTPARSVRTAPISSQSAKKAKGYRKPRPSIATRPVGKPVGKPAGRLSQQAMARSFRSDKIKSSEFVQESSEDEIEESPQEDVNGPPKGSPEPSDNSDDDNNERPTPKVTPGEQHQREQSVDLSLVSPVMPTVTSALPSAQPRTYSRKRRDAEASILRNSKSSKGKKRANERDTSAQEEEGVGEATRTPGRKKRGKHPEVTQGEEGEPSTPRGSRNARTVQPSQEQAGVARTPGRGERMRPAEVEETSAQIINRTPRSKKRALMSISAIVGDEEPARTPRSAKQARTDDSARAEGASTPRSAKRPRADPSSAKGHNHSGSKDSWSAVEPTWEWMAVNQGPRPTAVVKEAGPSNAMSVVSSDMDDMDDIPARLPRPDDEDE